MRTLFVDLDGCVFKHMDDDFHKVLSGEIEQDLLPGVKDKFAEWSRKAYNVIITTGRKESSRDFTMEQLRKHGLQYDQLIMGLKRWPRVLINDKKNDGSNGAYCINLDRDTGFLDMEIP